MPNKNIYIFSGESYMMKRSVRKLTQSLDISNEQLNITDFKSMPKADVLIAACVEVPFMSALRLVIVSECSVLRAKGGAQEAKKIAEYIEKIPDTTVLILCVDSADKRRSLYKQVKKIGQIKEFGQPRQAECIQFVVDRAKANGAQISRNAATELVAVAGCDYFTLHNELDKLIIYSENNEITMAHIKECSSRTLEYNVFQIHEFFVNKQAAPAKKLLNDILRAERPEMLIGLFARKIRDMYKVKMMSDAHYSTDKIAKMLKTKSFIAQRLHRECKRFSAQELRCGLLCLADLDYGIKSGEKDASLALPEALVEIYKL